MAIKTVDENQPHIHCGDIPENRNIFNGGATICGWFFLDGVGQNGTGRIISKSVSASPSDGWTIYIDGGRLVIGKGFTTVNGFWETTSVEITTGRWIFWAIVYNAINPTFNPTMWIDDGFVSVTETTAPSGSFESDATEELIIFNTQTVDRGFNGRQADVQAFDSLLVADELSDIFAGNGKHSQFDTLFHYQMKEGSRDDIAFPTDLFRGSAQTIDLTTGSTFVNVLPTGKKAPKLGDIMFCAVLISGNSTTDDGTHANLSTPATWTKLNIGNTDFGSGGSVCSIHLYGKVASASEPTDYTFNITNMNSNGEGAYLIIKPSGLDTTPQTVPSIINTGDSSSPTAPSVSMSGDSFVIRVFAIDDNDPINLPLTTIPIIDAFGDGADNNGSSLRLSFEVLTGATTGTIVGDIPASTEAFGCFTVNYPGAEKRQLTDFNPTKDYSPAQNHGIPNGRPELPVFIDDELQTGIVI